MAEAAPDSRLRWTLLAAVGRVLTDHGQRGDHRVDDRGNVRPGIVGKPLLARGGHRVGDTEAGLLDDDRRFDRPVGPMLLSPADWSVVGVDGDSNGKRNPQDVDDASLALAVLLCAPGVDLRTPEGKRAALPRIDDTPDFVQAVLEVDAAYRQQVRSGVEQLDVGPPITLPELPSLPSLPKAKHDRAPQPRHRRTPASTRVACRPAQPVSDHADPDDGTDLPAPEPEPEPVQTSTNVSATYDSTGMQISATAVVSADGVAPTGGVTFTLTGPDGVKVAQAALAGGSASVRFEVTPGGVHSRGVVRRHREHLRLRGKVRRSGHPAAVGRTGRPTRLSPLVIRPSAPRRVRQRRSRGQDSPRRDRPWHGPRPHTRTRRH